MAVLAPLAGVLSYGVPESVTLARGDIVRVPLGHGKVHGVIISHPQVRQMDYRLKAVHERLDEPSVPEAALSFWEWAAQWTMTAPGTFYAGCLRALKAPKPGEKWGYEVTGRPLDKAHAGRERVLDALVMPLGLSEITTLAGVGAVIIKTMERDGLIRKVTLDRKSLIEAPNPDFTLSRLNEGQTAAVHLITAQDSRGFRPVLLDGVTGSGKTEVYFEVMAETLRRDPDARILILLPEIALTQAVIERFQARFGVQPIIWHSDLSPGRRRAIWEGVAEGRIRLVIGARSALFLPFAAFSLIVIDEEHDGSYKQDEGVHYQARDLALRRAQMDGAMIILASATPSLESLHHAQSGRFLWVRLDARFGVAVLPETRLIDLKANPPEKGMWLSEPLIAAMRARIELGEQSLLFMNRRGYAPLVLCKACGEGLTAPGTEYGLVEHRGKGGVPRLVCHMTGFVMKKPDTCPKCGAKDSFISVGPGVERIREEVEARFPDARVEIFSSDTTPTAAATRALIARMTEGEIDILIATQAAAKGHNFPKLTLVGIVDADAGLKGGDLRAGERTFQLLGQATGRAGRAEHRGEALIQTYQPDHPAMVALTRHDRDGFYAYEMAARELMKFPPFGRLAALILSAKDEAGLARFGKQLALCVPNTDGIEVYGPSDAPLTLLRGQYRKRFLIRADRNRDLQGFIAHWLGQIKKPSAIKLVIDIDPYSFW